VFYALQQECKMEMKRYLAHDLHHKDVVAITMEKSNAIAFHFEDKEEFTYEGNMYDVVHKESKAGKVIFYCIEDKKETGLLQAFLKHQNAEKNKTKMQQAGQFLTELSISSFPSTISSPEPVSIKHQAHYSFSFSIANLTIVTPPPQFAA